LAPAVPPPAAVVFAPQAPPVPIVHDLLCSTLLHPSHLPETNMPLDKFCINYVLSINVLNKLHKNSYVHACVLRFVTIEKLKEMGFRLGEIAALRDVVEAWSVAKAI
jgi:hypothetical protein